MRRSMQNSAGSLLFFGNDSLYSFDFHNIEQGATRLHCPREICLVNKVEDVEDLDDSDDDCIVGTELVGSCNGLLCFQLPNSQFALYNPTTREYKQLPKVGKDFKGTYCFSGEFAYDSRTDDYKVLRFAEHHIDDCDCCYGELEFSESHIYSLKAKAWEIIPDSPFDDGLASRSVVANNSLHFITCIESKVIWRFDLFTREYQEMQLPQCLLSDSYDDAIMLASLKGQLHLMTEDYEIWRMEEYGVVESWTKVFHGLNAPLETVIGSNLVFLHRPQPYAYSKDGRKILVGVEKQCRIFLCCDLEHQTASKVEIIGVPFASGKIVAEPWVASIIPLDRSVSTQADS